MAEAVAQESRSNNAKAKNVDDKTLAAAEFQLQMIIKAKNETKSQK